MNPDLRPILVSLVPRAWTAQQAHNAVNLLQQAIAAIWHVHGASMERLVLGDLSDPKRPAEARPTSSKRPER